MAGCTKFTTINNTRAWTFTAPLPTLNGQTNFTASAWFQIVSSPTGIINTDLIHPDPNYQFNINYNGLTNKFLYSVQSAGNVKNIQYIPNVDTKGHFIAFSYNATGVSVVYVDGSPVKTLSNIGVTDAVNQTITIGSREAGSAITVYEKDVAIWSGYSATQTDIIALRDYTYTPGTLISSATSLLTPATNWWTLQGPSGVVTNGTQGLADSGTAGFNLTKFTDSGASITYDPFEITLSFSVAMMAPFSDITGNLVCIPVYNDPDTTTGGPATPVSINVDPTWKLNGSDITLTLIPTYIYFYSFLYQMPSGVSLLPTDVLTMSAPLGWASATAGILQGTSTNGLLSTPLTVVNNVGRTVESIFDVPKVMKIGYDVGSAGNANNSPAQPRANWASRVQASGDGWTSALTYHTNGLPATISGPSHGTLFFDQYNDVDLLGTPSTEGLHTLVYGDSSNGVSSSGPNQSVELGFNTSWNVTRNVANSGHWDSVSGVWTGIVKTYQTVYSGSGSYNSNLSIIITSNNSNVDFPSKGNGQVELGVFPPSPSNRNISSPTNWDPLGTDPEYLLKLKGASAVRWMPDLCGYQFDGDSSVKLKSDLDNTRLVTDFLWTKQSNPVSNIISAAPIGISSGYIDYLAAYQTISANNWNKASLYTRVPMEITTDVPHGLRTGDLLVITGTTGVPQPVVKQDNLRLLSPGITGTNSPYTFQTDSAAPMLIGDAVLIDSEQLTVTAFQNGIGLTNISVTATRGTAGTTPATHASGAVVYTNFLTAAITTISQTGLTLSRTAYPNGLLPGVQLQIDLEQMSVVSNNSPTSLTVTRGINGTIPATHSNMALIYPVIPLDTRNTKVSPMVTSPTGFVIGINHSALPVAFGTAVSNPTLSGTTTFTPNKPTMVATKPFNIGSVPYEFTAKTTNTIALQNGYLTILWINVSIMATDDLVTEIFANRIIPYITSPNLYVVVELGNEIWNTSSTVFVTSNILAITAPNPDTPSAPFVNGPEWVASRQNHVNNLAKAAFTAAGLDPARVYNFQPGQSQINSVQSTSQAIISYCQIHNIPIDLLTIAGYVDITTIVWNLWWSWMSQSDGGSAVWSRGTARQVMMSYFRMWCWFGQYLGGHIFQNTQLLSWYKAGQLVSTNGIGSSIANSGLGKLCFYESATEIISGAGVETNGKTAYAGDFLHPNAMQQDLTYDPHWLATETAYIASKQGASKLYADLMPSGSFPDKTSATPLFSCLFTNVGNWGGQGQGWLTYNWQGQQPGSGINNVMGWDVINPSSVNRPNQSVRAQAAIDWIGSPNFFITSFAPPDASIGNSIFITVTATFNNPIQTGTLTFTLKDLNGNNVPGTLQFI